METRLAPPTHNPEPSTSTAEAVDPSGKSSETLKIAEKLTRTIMNHIDKNDARDLFSDVMNPFDRGDEVICIQVAQVFSRLNEADKIGILGDIMGLVEECRKSEVSTSEIYERTIDNILYYLMDKELLNENWGLSSLVHTTDYTLRSSINRHKWEFISEKWKNMGMKGIRHLFKSLLGFQQKLSPVLSAAQKRQLVPLENLLVEILDMVPAIFTLTELYQFKHCIHLHAFARVVEKIAQIKAYCRPLADLVFVVGRSFMFPILAHPLFTTSAASWKVDKNLTMLFSRLTYLPNRKELASEQVYFFHMIMKQPKGKEVLSSILKQVAKNQAPRTFEHILTIMINETMAAVEKLPPNKEIPRYQWDHLLSCLVFMAQFEFSAIYGVIKNLKTILPKQNHTRARDEIMWLVLQITGAFATQVSKELSEDMASLHKVLYPVTMKSDTYTTDDPERMYRFVRHLSTACFYVLEEEKSLPPPSQYLENQIEFIKLKSQEVVTELPLMAILTNAFRNETSRKVLLQIMSRVDGNPNEEQFHLPYGKPVNNLLQPLDMALIDSLTMRSRLHLLQALGLIFMKVRDKMPSPAYIESYCRLLYSLEFDYGVKSFGNLISKVASQSNSQGAPESFRDYMHVILDMLANRLTNLPTVGHFRQTTCLTLISVLHSTCSNVQGAFSRELYSLVEQVLMREFSWMPHTEIIRFCFEFLGKSKAESRSVNAHLANPDLFYNTSTDSKNFHVCPEIVRMLHMSLLKTAKIMDKDFSEEPDFLNHIGCVFKWTPVQMRSFPTAFKNVPGIIEESTDCRISDEIFNKVHSDFMQMRGLPGSTFVEYMIVPEQKPTILCVIYRAIQESADDMQVYPFYYQVLNMLSPRYITVATNWLSEFVIHQISENPELLNSAVQTLLNMVFHRHMIPFERILLALILHPSNDAKAKIGLSIIFALLESQECKDRLSLYEQRIPPKQRRGKEFFEGNAEFHSKYPEFTYQELLNTAAGAKPVINPKFHPSTYFGSLIDRMLPILDVIVTRSMELELGDMRSFFGLIAPIYKYHPNIFSFVYTLLHTQHESIGHSTKARVFVRDLIGSRRQGAGYNGYLTPDYLEYNHQHRPFEAVVEVLIRRIIECSEFIIEPPEYVEPDWRTAELSAPAQALFLGCIELMASPHDASKTIPAIISVLCKSDIVYTRPYATLNAVGQLLTALPSAYAKELHRVYAEVFEQHRLNDLTFEDIVYDNFEESVLLRMTNREMTINYALQAYWHHGNQYNVSQFTQFFLTELYDKITSENELWYFLRLMIPLQQWVYETKIKHFYTDCIRQAKGVMDKLGQLCQGPTTLEHGAEVCDVLYHLKYQCLGDSLNNEAMELLEKLPKTLQARFKYYLLSKTDDPPAQAKLSSVVQPDLYKLIKTRSNASERN